MNTRRRLAHRGAFTLVELLVVITIIAVLVSLTVVGVAGAIQTAKQTKIKVEADQIASAFEAYKAKYGSYPPADISNPASNALLKAHIARAFPRYNINNLATDLAAAGVGTSQYDPQVALVFWLQGFSPDITSPIQGAGTRVPLFDFDRSRITTISAGVVVYKAPYGNSAYAYIDSQNYGGLPSSIKTAPSTSSGAGVIAPYVFDANGNGSIDAGEDFAKPTSYQIISAGLDANFGPSTTARLYPTGVGYDPLGTDDDNITNFCERAKIGDAKP